MLYFYATEEETLKFQACRETLPPQLPHLVRHPDLPMRKTVRVVGLLIVMIFSESKKFTACKVKDEKEETTFYFLMVFNLPKIIDPFESKKHLRI